MKTYTADSPAVKRAWVAYDADHAVVIPSSRMDAVLNDHKAGLQAKVRELEEVQARLDVALKECESDLIVVRSDRAALWARMADLKGALDRRTAERDRLAARVVELEDAARAEDAVDPDAEAIEVMARAAWGRPTATTSWDAVSDGARAVIRGDQLRALAAYRALIDQDAPCAQ